MYKMYCSFDGKEFKTVKECEDHELAIKKKRELESIEYHKVIDAILFELKEFELNKGVATRIAHAIHRYAKHVKNENDVLNKTGEWWNPFTGQRWHENSDTEPSFCKGIPKYPITINKVLDIMRYEPIDNLYGKNQGYRMEYFGNTFKYVLSKYRDNYFRKFNMGYNETRQKEVLI